MQGGLQVTWQSPEASVILLTALNEDSAQGAASFNEGIDRATRATVPPALLRQKKTSERTVAGEQANIQSFVGLNYRFDAVAVRHEQVLLALLVTSRHPETLNEVLAGLRWLE